MPSAGDTRTPERISEAGAPRGNPFGARFVAPLYLGASLNPVNSSIIATALVAIAAALHIPVGDTAILISSLYLTSALAQPAAGRLAEEFGPRRIFVAGITLVLVAGIVGSLAHSLTALIVARVLVGAGTSAGYPAAMLLIRRRAEQAGHEAPPREVLGGLSITGAATVAVGPAIGGLLIGGAGWRAAFWINIPVAAIALFLALAGIARDPDPVRFGSPRALASRIDLLGMLGFGGSLTALMIFLDALPRLDWPALAAALLLAAALAGWELRAAQPFLDVRLLVANGALTRTYLRNGLTLMGTYVILYGLTQWLEVARGLSAYQAGLMLMPMGVLTALAARVVSRRAAVRWPLIACAVLLLVGAVATLFVGSGTPMVAVICVTAVFGLTSGAGTVANQTVLYQEAPAAALGTASGLLRTFGYVGSIASAAITGTAFHRGVSDSGLHSIAWVLVAISALVLVMTVLDRQLARADRHHTNQTPAGARNPGPAPSTEPTRTESRSTDMTTGTHTTPALDPARTALLLMDFQPVVLGAVPDPQGVLARAGEALAWARAHGVHVVFVRVALGEKDAAAVPAHNKTFSQAVAAGYLTDGTAATAVHESLKAEEDDLTVRKTRISAFASDTDLRAELRARNVDTLVLAGLSTSGVVLTTLRQAADEDYRLFLLADATADPDPEVHRVLMEKVFPHQAEIISTADLAALRTAAR
ncbi:MFS transporter [Streptomyces mirabilis]|uniref:Nicotinamidase-related amidase n=1 Tax=Streptomyces mirabilis TaxID=68239 RepID=A0A1I2SU62_9ACTN|nr:MFS transporter [Streptomyces mirabilis]SFG53431.1 Nicotinamidase-related amidase [Streptomyces mirabilis]